MYRKLALYSALSLTANYSTMAQESTTAHAASKVDMNGSYLQINQLDGHIDTVTDYLNLICDVARKNGEKIPEDLDLKKLIKDVGLGNLKALAQSSIRKDDVWINRRYLETGANNSGIFSLIGGQAKPFSVAQIAPAGSDIAIQVQLDLRQLEELIYTVARAANKEPRAHKILSKKDDKLKMSRADFLKKANFTAQVIVDLHPEDKLLVGPFKVGRPNVAICIEGAAWLWDVIEPEITKKAPVKLQKKDKNGIITYSLAAEAQKQMKGYSPTVVIDKNKNQIWISADSAFLNKCRGKGDKLVDTEAFKATWQGMPSEGNSMLYISKDLLTELKTQYQFIANTGMLGEDFQKAKPLVDKIVIDLTKSKIGFAASLGKDLRGIEFVSKSPLPSSAMKLMPLLTLLDHGQGSCCGNKNKVRHCPHNKSKKAK